jgi:twitching motility protein PilT
MWNMRDLLEQMVSRNASDLHLSAGLPPSYRVDGAVAHGEGEPLGPEDTQKLAYSVLTDEQRKRFEVTKELDLSFGIKGLSRFRANVFQQRGVISMAIRQIPYSVMGFEELGLPAAARELTLKPRGLVLVTGPTGSGKSTTLASMIDLINGEREGHIITIEDPIEYVHSHKKCIVNQREVNTDTQSFAAALKYVLRQDPDIILVGEMRDLETIAAALTIAETGHLVFATLHTNSTFESVNRIVDVFPAEQQEQIRAQLAFCLEGVITQQLVPHLKGRGRVLVSEMLMVTQAVRAVIREGKVHQIYTLMQAGQKHGMQTMNQALYQAYINRKISLDEALGRSPNVPELEQLMGKTGQRAAA